MISPPLFLRFQGRGETEGALAADGIARLERARLRLIVGLMLEWSKRCIWKSTFQA